MIRSTTILCVRKDRQVAMAGDGQVSMNNTVLKHHARKVRKVYHDQILTGFAGTAADAFTLFARFEAKLEEYRGSLTRAAVELAKDWRADRVLRRLEALLAVADRDSALILSGTGDIIEPDDGIIGIGSGGPYAHCRRARPAAAHYAQRTGDRRSGDAYYGRYLYLHQHLYKPRRIRTLRQDWGMDALTPREIVQELDKYIVGQDKAKRAVAIALRNRWRRQQLPPELRDEVAPKNIIMIGPTGVGKTEIARRLAALARSPFLKVEASKFTEVGYVGRDVESMVRDLVELGKNLVQQEEMAARRDARQGDR